MYVEISRLFKFYLFYKLTTMIQTTYKQGKLNNMVMFDICGTKREMTYSTCSTINIFWGTSFLQLTVKFDTKVMF
jgi:hypothetical protein